MSKKIGLLTFQRTVNYGAQFQSYALYKYIKNQGCSVEVIDYQNDDINKVEKPMAFYKQKNIKQMLKFFKCHKFHQSKWKKFEEFRTKNIEYSKECNCRTIKNICNGYDGVVVGSDQVWNTDITGKDYTYYLDFLEDSKKYTYAVSFGFPELPNQEKDAILKFINEFSEINLRESSAMQMLKEVKVKKNVVLDPTFLLSKEEWISSFNLKKNTPSKDYIFVYMIDEDEKNIQRLKDLAGKENLEIIHIRDGFRELDGIKTIRDASPRDFLNLLYNAKYTVIGSFHGLCLSMIFEKDFYYVLNGGHNRNSRLVDLLNKAHLEERNDFSINERIDYAKVAERLKEDKKSSISILKNTIKRIEEKNESQ